ncbi:LytTR family transcriptional regulator DNA-binding domain-containing protein [Paenibacillus pini]|uniref:HTH LytTR-type domain-containing protein n=1 Tax=Paenibacillus pini JCM 16418 TaxID=1236976 RepID=W7Z8P1_9BACL|nr:LytTR family transcriptional regulator DNA-binding domain-containing protein [Paenibacillus pini]GAF10804.1 hypothetical protein JCM16418_5026 [Paenibacillus pini JCM 16418]
MKYTKRLINIVRARFSELDDVQKCHLLNTTFNDLRFDPETIIIPLANNSIRLMHVNDILYIKEPKKGKVFIVTINEEIEFKNSATNLLEYIEKVSPPFRFLNNGLVANLDKATHYNSYLRKVYFHGNKTVDVTGAAMTNIIQKVLGKNRDEHRVTFIGNFEH